MKGRGLAAGVALSWGLVVAVGAYAAVRCIHFFVYPEADPAALTWSPHSGYFWRVGTVAYAGGIAAFVALLLARDHLAAAARALLPALGLAAAALALQVVFFP